MQASVWMYPKFKMDENRIGMLLTSLAQTTIKLKCLVNVAIANITPATMSDNLLLLIIAALFP